VPCQPANLGLNAESIIARGPKAVRFLGIESHSRQQPYLELRTFELRWKGITNGFNPLIYITFFLLPKPRVEKLANVQTNAMFNTLLTSVDRKIALQVQESNQRGIYFTNGQNYRWLRRPNVLMRRNSGEVL
jgi:hypothetical protein